MKKKTPVTIFSRFESSRLSYVCQWIFGEKMGVPYQIITTPGQKSLHGIQIGYGINHPDSRVEMDVQRWMEDGYFERTQPELLIREDLPLPVWSEPETGLWPDLFSAIFWSLSRAEEIGSTESDAHGRFLATASWAYKNQVLETAWIDRWIRHLATELEITIEAPDPFLKPSIDIDEAYAFRGRGVFRLLGGMVTDLWKRRLRLLRHRGLYALGLGKDPYDRFDEIDRWLDNIKKNSHIFFLLGDPGDRLDRNLDPDSPYLKLLIREWSSPGRIGIHPSYHSMEDPQLIVRQKEVLEAISGQTITDSRFHYLRFRIPGSYRHLISAGIRQEHSMIYADAPGYRAGTGSSFLWYDLEKEEVTDLRIHPYILMDQTFMKYLRCDSDESVRRASKLKEECRMAGVPFSWIWHNSTMGPLEEWEKFDELRRSLVRKD